MSPFVKFVHRFSKYEVLGNDIFGFFKYKKFPMLTSRRYRIRNLYSFSKITKPDLITHWKRIYKTIKKEYLPRRMKLPVNVPHFHTDFRSYVKYGYFVSQLNEATREIMGNADLGDTGVTCVQRGSKRGAVNKVYIFADIWQMIIQFLEKKSAFSLCAVNRKFYALVHKHYNDYVIVTSVSVWQIPPLLLRHMKKLRIKGKLLYSSLDNLFRQINCNTLQSISIKMRRRRNKELHEYCKKYCNEELFEYYKKYFVKKNLVFPCVKEIINDDKPKREVIIID
jgi:hypothetical protein